MRSRRAWIASIAFAAAVTAVVVTINLTVAGGGRDDQRSTTPAGRSVGESAVDAGSQATVTPDDLSRLTGLMREEFSEYSLVYSQMTPQRDGSPLAEVIMKSSDGRYVAHAVLAAGGETSAEELRANIDAAAIDQSESSRILTSGNVLARDGVEGTQVLAPLGDGRVLNVWVQNVAHIDEDPRSTPETLNALVVRLSKAFG